MHYKVLGELLLERHPQAQRERPVVGGVGDAVVGVEGFGRHHFLPSSALNSRLPYDEKNSVGAQILSWEREYGPNTNLPPAK